MQILVELIAATGLLLSIASFIVFVVLTSAQYAASKSAAKMVPSDAAAKNLAGVDPAKVLEAAAKLLEAFAKAGPGLSALVASVLFLGVAGYTATGSQGNAKGEAGTQQH